MLDRVYEANLTSRRNGRSMANSVEHSMEYSVEGVFVEALNGVRDRGLDGADGVFGQLSIKSPRNVQAKFGPGAVVGR